MELQEDAYRLNEVLSHVKYETIVNFLRTKVSSDNTEIRCRIALQYFLNVQNNENKNVIEYEEDLTADFMCLKHILPSVPDDEIQTILRILGLIPNRKLIAAKILLHQSNGVYRKRKINAPEDPNEASSSKLIKVADSTDSFKISLKPKAHSQIPKLILKRDKNANEFVVSSPNKSTEQPSTSQPVEPDKPKKILREPVLKFFVPDTVQLNNVQPTEAVETRIPDYAEARPSLDYAVPGPSLDYVVPGPSLDYAVPGPSRLFEVTEAGPSTSADYPDAHHNDGHLAEMLGLINEVIDGEVGSSDSEKTVIDLSITNVRDTQAEIINADFPPKQNGDNEEKEEPSLPVDEKLVLKIMEMFPEALPDYVRKICAGRQWNVLTFNEIVEMILTNENYPRRPERALSPEKEVDTEEQFRTVEALLPDADPTFLLQKVEHYAGDRDGLTHFIEDALTNKNYPTMKDYIKRQQLSAQQRQYTTEFNVDRFLEIFPDPVKVFEDPQRKTTISDASDKYYVKWFMRNKFRQLYARDINNIVEHMSKVNVVSIVQALEKCMQKGCLKKSKFMPLSQPELQNIPLLQELAYFEHKDKILKHLENKKQQAELEKQNAKELGLLQTCSCCFDEEVMPCDILTCTAGCRFCRDCITRSTEVAYGDGKIDFPCLMGNECNAEFSLQVLQTVLAPKLFSKLAQKKAVAEVKAAGVADLETCPFCDFATIPAPEDKLFRCLNPDCMKESCRQCKEPSHVPLRCDEVEKDADVKARTYIENKMTEALIRECWKCGAKFIKVEGCNKMTCSCGAMMCYICRKPVKDYKHFNGQGGDRYHLCPLYTDNFVVNEKNVIKAAEEAKKEINVSQLKNDPAADLNVRFEKQIKKDQLRGHQRAERAAMNWRHNHGNRRRNYLEIEQYYIRQLQEELRTVEARIAVQGDVQVNNQPRLHNPEIQVPPEAPDYYHIDG